VAASAHHLHYVPITDTRYSPLTLAEFFPDDPEAPLFEWVVYSGDDQFSTFSPDGLIVTTSVGSGTAEVVADAPSFEDITNPLATAFFEFEVSSLDDSGLQTIELGWTDLIGRIKWDEASGVISGDREGVADFDVGGVPRWSDHGSLPLRIRMYYQFQDFVLTFVVVDEDGNLSAPFTWQSDGVANPFRNFFGVVPGTDPDNLDIYPFLLCEAQCTVEFSQWEMLDCSTVDGDVDIANCHTPDLSIAVDDGRTIAVPGQPLTYVLTASNVGTDEAAGADVTGEFPEELTDCTWTCVGSGGADCAAGPVDGDISDTVTLPVGAVAEYTATCTVEAAATGLLSYTATISGDRDSNLANNSATDIDVIAPVADLAITNDDGQGTAVPGGSVTYGLTATNFGPSGLTGATVSDPFPSALDCDWTCVESGGASCAVSGSGAISELVDLPAGATATFTATCDIDSAALGILVNVASIFPPSGAVDTVAGNNSAADADLLTPEADLSIAKSDGVVVISPGAPVTYTIVAASGGPSDALTSSIEDLLPAELIDCSWTCSSGPGASCSGGPVFGNLVDDIDLPAGSQATYTVDCTVDPAANFELLTNTATIDVAAGVTETNPVDNSATDTDISVFLLVFVDGFESGDITAWSTAGPMRP
jgi:uncharacterized repeat protein (TIGR01451 family)